MTKFLSVIGLSGLSLPAFAAAPVAAVPQQGSSLPSLVMIVVFVLVFYFLLIRPQSKRAKDQRNLLNTLQKGDEVLTTSGICGTVAKIDNNFVELEVAKDVVVKLQKQAIVSLLPKMSSDVADVK